MLHLPDRIPLQEPLSGASSLEAYVPACCSVATCKRTSFHALHIAQGGL